MAKKDSLTPPLPFSWNKEKAADLPIHIYTDGASRGNPGLAGIGVVIRLGDGTVIEEKRFLGEATNNTAEYEALIHALSILKDRRLYHPLKIHADSQLMVRQLNGRYKIKHPHLRKLAGKVHALLKLFPSHEIIYIPRRQNKRADKLANEAIDERNG